MLWLDIGPNVSLFKSSSRKTNKTIPTVFNYLSNYLTMTTSTNYNDFFTHINHSLS